MSEQRCGDCPARYANGACGHCDEGQGFAAPPDYTEVRLGEGKFLDGYGMVDGLPMVAYEPSPRPGPPSEVCSLDLPKVVQPGAIVLSFTTRAAVYQHIDLLMQMLQKSDGEFVS